ncbi:MAG: GNAT family N-acetyltransferase [Desulfosarcina sp.]|nr:GNAT family N-acetyltransferase [Desulfosarcina sp.]MBC2741794.1 GNAT family N-acetyltransferase [Desulfosarcina sp.]MBC2764708.1 GNAT family N-acetyltransferase [Desulfosarcina sp.]
MTASAPFTILLIHPPPATRAIPLLTLAQVTGFLSNTSTTTHMWDANLDGFNNGGNRLPDLLGQLSANNDTHHFFCVDEINPTQLENVVIRFNKRQTGFRLSISCIMENDIASDFTAMADSGPIVQIQWRVMNRLPDLRYFMAFSRAGIWNHLILDGDAATKKNCTIVSLQPNIIHSWEAETLGGPNSIGPVYSQVRPLPGRPLWQVVRDPIYRFLLVDRLGKNGFLRMRVDEDGDHLYTVGEDLGYHFCPPDQLPDGFLDDICAMVSAGGTVSTDHVRFNLERAYLIGYVFEKGVIVGNSCLKHPRPEYIETVRRQSGLDLTGYVERGYTSVRPEYRGLGIGTKLLDGLTQRAGDRKIFSVIAENNEATKTIAIRNRTRKVATYLSEKAGKPVGIWMPEWMIDTTNSEES